MLINYDDVIRKVFTEEIGGMDDLNSVHRTMREDAVKTAIKANGGSPCSRRYT